VTGFIVESVYEAVQRISGLTRLRTASMARDYVAVYQSIIASTEARHLAVCTVSRGRSQRQRWHSEHEITLAVLLALFIPLLISSGRNSVQREPP
jgi:Mg/Co/Ni transporter MgtE